MENSFLGITIFLKILTFYKNDLTSFYYTIFYKHKKNLIVFILHKKSYILKLSKFLMQK